MSDKDEENEEKKESPIIVRNTTDLQRLKLEKLMKNPEKPVIIPERPKARGVPTVPDFVRNVMGSSAGAGSGEFHVYRHLRRKEYARQKYMKEKAERERLDEEYHKKLEENKKLSEERTAKKRAKRLKRKQKMKKTKKPKLSKESSSSSEISEDESDRETTTETDKLESEEDKRKTNESTVEKQNEIPEDSSCTVTSSDNKNDSCLGDNDVTDSNGSEVDSTTNNASTNRSEDKIDDEEGET